MTISDLNLAPAVARSLAIWHEMIASGSMERLASISADDCVFRSPAFYKPYRGKEALHIVLSSVVTVFEDFAYHRTLTSADGLNVMLEFSASIGCLTAVRMRDGIYAAASRMNAGSMSASVMCRMNAGGYQSCTRATERASP